MSVKWNFVCLKIKKSKFQVQVIYHTLLQSYPVYNGISKKPSRECGKAFIMVGAFKLCLQSAGVDLWSKIGVFLN